MKKIIVILCVVGVIIGINIYPPEEMCTQAKEIAANEDGEAEKEEFTYKELDDMTIEISKYNGNKDKLQIPDKIEGKQVTRLGSYSFAWCSSLTSVIIPEGVTIIETGAFRNCENLSEVILPDSLVNLKWAAFGGCNIAEIKVPAGVKEMNGNPFINCPGLMAINVDSNNAFYTSEDGILYDKNKTRILSCAGGKADVSIIPSVKYIEDEAFCGCSNLTSIVVPESVISVGFGAFCDCTGLQKATILTNITELEQSTFFNCSSLRDISLPNTITSIGMYAFAHCVRLDKIEIPSNVAHIWVGSFIECAFDKITIPTSVNQIDQQVFQDCKNLKNVYYDGNKAQWDSIKLYEAYNEYLLNATIHCSDGVLIPGAQDSDVDTTPPDSDTTVPENGTTSQDSNSQITDQNTQTPEQVNIALSSSNVQLSKSSVTYNGKAQKPSVIVKNNDGSKIESANYTVSYANNKNVGQATVTVRFSGNYQGTVKKTFNIIPKGTTISKVTAKKKGLSVKWKKQTTQTTGYEIQYSTSSKFKGAKKAGNIKAKTTSKSISKLKAKKKYYVRIRTYKTVKGKKYYSNWSKSKSVITKK